MLVFPAARVGRTIGQRLATRTTAFATKAPRDGVSSFAGRRIDSPKYSSQRTTALSTATVVPGGGAASPSLAAHEIAIKLQSAPVTASLGEGFGTVEAVGDDARALFSKDDVVFATQIAGGFAQSIHIDDEASVAVAPATMAVKVPGEIHPAMGALFASALTAYRILLSAAAPGDVVVHVGAESAVGQSLAKLAEHKGIKLVSIVSRDVPEFEETVDIVKKLGATVAAPAQYARWPGFRHVMADLGPVSLVVMDQSGVDVAAVNALLDAAHSPLSAARAAVARAHPSDLLDAKILSAVLAHAKPGAARVAYGARPGDAPLAGATPFSLDGLFEASADKNTRAELDALADEVARDIAKQNLYFFVEAYGEGMLDHALARRDGGVYAHPYRQPIFLSDTVPPLETIHPDDL